MIRSIAGRLIRKLNNFGFQPYIKNFSITEAVDFRFFFATRQAREWYDPINPYALIEYQWIVRNINLINQKIIDGGAHHGQYSVILGVASQGSKIVSIDPIPANLALIEINMRLNGLTPFLEDCVIANQDGIVNFENTSNGRIVSAGGLHKVSKKLPSIMKDATIIKLDIEGAEFSVLPSQINEMDAVHTWIVEVHTRNNHPLELMDLFYNNGYKIDWVNRDKSLVEPYKMGTTFNCHHTTIFARR